MAVTLDGTTGITSPGEQVNGNLNVTGSITAGSYVGIVNGQIQTQLFTAPGTWTKPASCTQVKVTVIGGGGSSNTGGSGSFSGGTSSFGSAVSATGGSGASFPSPGSGSAPGTGTVSTGTALKTSAVVTSSTPLMNVTSGTMQINIGNLIGRLGRTGPGNPATYINLSYSTSSDYIAGGFGGNFFSNTSGGTGGLAIAIVPVSAPVAVTIGSGGNNIPITSGVGGIDGAVLVEFIG